MSKASIIFPHQMFEHHPAIAPDQPVYLVEEYLFFRQFNFHKQKLMFHRASMKAYQEYLQTLDVQVHYIESREKLADVRELIAFLGQEKSVSEIAISDPCDDWLGRRISEAAKQSGIDVSIKPTPQFLLQESDLPPFFKSSKKKFYQTQFYKEQRKRFDLLLDADQNPEGGKWSFDAENRKKYPKKKIPPAVHYPEVTDHFDEAKTYVEKQFSDNLGSIGEAPRYPINFSQAEAWLEDFLETRFFEFGPYEDAIVQEQDILHHSLLTPMLNSGLLEPKQILDKALEFSDKNEVPINSLEGFIRQIIGWREFIRGVYVVKGRQERTTNFWQFSRKIPASFYDGSTGIDPVDSTIKKVLETGYCHHIERLMVLGNFMLLCEFDPDEVYRWFMELFIDAYDWVMVPNVYGMSQFADGGLMSTKPYISGSNYLMKMSNYEGGDWQDIWDALFWEFLNKHRDFFLSNPRLSMLCRNYEKMDQAKKKAMKKKADRFLSSLDK